MQRNITGQASKQHKKIILILIIIMSNLIVDKRREERTGLEKSAAIRPFATKKSRLASETFLLGPGHTAAGFSIMIGRGRSGRDRKNLQRGHTTFSVSR